MSYSFTCHREVRPSRSRMRATWPPKSPRTWCACGASTAFPATQTLTPTRTEVIALLKAGYLGRVWYGFKRDESWIEPTIKYTAHDLYNGSAADDDPGKIRPGADVSGASFYSYLTYSAAWDDLTAREQDAFNKSLPFYRSNATEPPVYGYLLPDRTYSSGGRALDRASVRSY